MIESIVKRKQETKFHKETFEKTTADRQKKVLEVAISEFANRGYNATNINEIAKKSGISIGAMYSYFASKEDLFLTIVNNAYVVLEEALFEVTSKSKDFSDFLKRALVISREYALRYPELNQIYIDLTTQALSTMSVRLSNKMESISIQLYRNVIKQAKERGEIGSHIDVDICAFCMDNLFLAYQFSFASDYYKERMKIFLGEDKLADIEGVESSIIDFIKRAFSII